MSTWSEAPLARGTRGTVLRGGEAANARSARMDSELRTTAFAPSHGVDARLTDPHLQGVVERARRAAEDSGRAAGHAQGYAAGLAAAAAEAAAVLASAADAFRSQEQLVLADVEDVVADLALSIARAVLARELAVMTDPGGEAIARALALAPDGSAVTVRLHPQDVAVLGELGELAPGRELVLIADPDVEAGGCVAEAAGRHVDAQVGPALERVAAVLRGGTGAGPRGETAAVPRSGDAAGDPR
jgi:flagellar assembly protein FliH